MISKQSGHISNITSKRHGILTEKLIIFFQMQEKNWPEFEWKILKDHALNMM